MKAVLFCCISEGDETVLKGSDPINITLLTFSKEFTNGIQEWD